MDANETAFDLNRYLRVCGATKPECFDWTTPQPRLGDDALFTIAYMMDIESYTIVYLRDLLSTHVVRDNDVTAFLSCWAYEEFFHSLLLRRFLATQGVAIGDQRFADLRSKTSFADRVIRPGIAVLSRITRNFPAVHMTFGAINEISTLTGYQALIRRTDFTRDRSDSPRPLLTTILERIIKDERRHFAFYFNQARRRLRVPAARRLTALLVRNFWTPVGVTVRGDPAMRRVCAYLFPGESGVELLAGVDRSIARLPGLEWFDLGARYARRVQASAPRIFFPSQVRSSG
ncbi:MAG TPA: hypothetical protein VIW95_02280 [Candidatus Binatus sp.]|jgi:hypothetical protein|uniref:hypothetical protein n=1 Tax=Candidatus Binatus sp. TaxID=2811406 RepID=UPI002F3F9A50